MQNINQKLIRPKAIHPGATLGVVCPSKWAPEDEILSIGKMYEERGYKILYGNTPFLRDHQFAGSPNQRAQDIEKMFADPDVDAIVCARGGYGANRVIPLLNYELIRKNPKIFMGYSDITMLLHSMNQQSGLVTFHGPMFVSYKPEFVPYNWENWENIISGKSPLTLTNPSDLPPRVLKPGKASGPFTGGNITLVANRLGTPRQINCDGAILMLEDIHEYLYAFDRYLVHLRQSGSLENIQGLLVGELVDMQDEDIPFGKTTDEIIMDVFGDMDIPIVSNVACGHGQYQMTLPIGHPCEIDATETLFSIKFHESPVSPN